jgi:hypothetical protein
MDHRNTSTKRRGHRLDRGGGAPEAELEMELVPKAEQIVAKAIEH